MRYRSKMSYVDIFNAPTVVKLSEVQIWSEMFDIFCLEKEQESNEVIIIQTELFNLRNFNDDNKRLRIAYGQYYQFQQKFVNLIFVQIVQRFNECFKHIRYNLPQIERNKIEIVLNLKPLKTISRKNFNFSTRRYTIYCSKI